MKQLVVATRNRGKLAEIEQRLAATGHLITSLDDYDQRIEIVEDCDTFGGNALKKARAVSTALGLPTLSDDSGLEVDALNGRPGVLSARYGGEQLDDAGRWALLLQELSGIPEARRTARFQAAMAYVAPGAPPQVFHGMLEGRIAPAPAGAHGFGYDPVFIPNGYAQTLALLGPDIKNRISHRATALDAFVRFISSSYPTSGTRPSRRA